MCSNQSQVFVVVKSLRRFAEQIVMKNHALPTYRSLVSRIFLCWKVIRFDWDSVNAEAKKPAAIALSLLE